MNLFTLIQIATMVLVEETCNCDLLSSRDNSCVRCSEYFEQLRITSNSVANSVLGDSSDTNPTLSDVNHICVIPCVGITGDFSACQTTMRILAGEMQFSELQFFNCQLTLDKGLERVEFSMFMNTYGHHGQYYGGCTRTTVTYPPGVHAYSLWSKLTKHPLYVANLHAAIAELQKKRSIIIS